MMAVAPIVVKRAVCRPSHQAVTQRERRRRGARLDAELGEDARHVVADGLVTDSECLGDLRVGAAFDQGAGALPARVAKARTDRDGPRAAARRGQTRRRAGSPHQAASPRRPPFQPAGSSPGSVGAARLRRGERGAGVLQRAIDTGLVARRQRRPELRAQLRRGRAETDCHRRLAMDDRRAETVKGDRRAAAITGGPSERDTGAGVRDGITKLTELPVVRGKLDQN